ncbi:MAG: DUF6428 family protein [Panacibacter sp.]
MKLSKFKEHLSASNTVNFMQLNNVLVPAHFHVTEVGLVSRNFIDCGGTVRNEKAANFQLWEANDFDHRLAPQKLLNILALSEKVLGNEDLEIEVEYQAETIGLYGLEFNGKEFVLTAKRTNCLAKDKCGIPPEKLKVNLAAVNTTCKPGGGCC